MRLFARTLLASALLACAAASQAQIGEDWMAGKVTTGNPAIPSHGAPIEIKYGPTPPPAPRPVPVTHANPTRATADTTPVFCAGGLRCVKEKAFAQRSGRGKGQIGARPLFYTRTPSNSAVMPQPHHKLPSTSTRKPSGVSPG